MNQRNTIVIALGAIIVIGIIILMLQSFGVFHSLFAKKGKVVLHDKTISVEVVSNEKDRAKGLSKRKSLAKDTGMLFTFDSADYHPFWMKDMLFSIDMLFIKDTKIVTIYHNIPFPKNATENANPPLYTPIEPADKTLELPAGTADAIGAKEGDTVTITL